MSTLSMPKNIFAGPDHNSGPALITATHP